MFVGRNGADIVNCLKAMPGDKWHNALFSVAGPRITPLGQPGPTPVDGYPYDGQQRSIRAIAHIEACSDCAIQHASANPVTQSRYAQKNISDG